MQPLPTISAVICTRDRGPSAVLAVQSILANNHPNFELILIDQSGDQRTEEALVAFSDDSRFRYVRSSTIGLGVARNTGLQLARGAVVAFTDDDCSVPENWLEVFAAAFSLQPRVAVAFSTVEAGPHDAALGFVPAYTCHRNRVLRTFWGKNQARSIGASMAVRREVALQMGGFDEMLGAGSHFASAEDADIAIRAIAMGHWVYESADVAVTHYGFRTWQEGKALARRDWLGLGACYLKPLRAGHWGALINIIYEIVGPCFLEPMRPMLALRRPRGLGRMLAFFSGLINGMHYPIDPTQIAYQQPADLSLIDWPVCTGPQLIPPYAANEGAISR